jgi:HAD superfamily hydrolase (TIGR01509 family)
MSTWPRAVLFDFDGVIVNSEPLHFQAFKEVLHREGIELSEEEYYRDLIGFDDKGAFRHVYERRGNELPPRTFLALMADKSAVMIDLIHRKKLEALPGVEETVRQLWRRLPLAMAIVSGGLREEIELMLEGVALRDCFQFIVAAEDVAVGKPDPQGYLMATERISENLLKLDKARKPLKPADCLVIEDAPSVIKRAKRAGFRTMGVCNTYGPQQLADADWIVDSLKPADLKRQCPPLQMEG